MTVRVSCLPLHAVCNKSRHPIRVWGKNERKFVFLYLSAKLFGNINPTGRTSWAPTRRDVRRNELWSPGTRAGEPKGRGRELLLQAWLILCLGLPGTKGQGLISVQAYGTIALKKLNYKNPRMLKKIGLNLFQRKKLNTCHFTLKPFEMYSP